MDTTFPARYEPLFFTGFLIVAALWLGASLYVVVSRLLFDRRQRRLMALERDVTDPAVASLPILNRSPAIHRILSKRSRWDVYRMLSSSTLPSWLSDIGAAYCLGHIGLDQLSRDAAPGGRKWRRISALFALGHLRTADAYDQLATAMEDVDPDVANAASVVLRRLGDRRAASILVSGLRTGCPLLSRSRFATQLEQFPIRIHDLIAPLLRDQESQVRYWAASLLMNYANVPGLAAEVAPLADDPDPQVRKAAITTLSAIGDAAAVPIGSRRLDDEVPYVRSAARRLLNHMGETGVELPPGLAARLASLELAGATP